MINLLKLTINLLIRLTIHSISTILKHMKKLRKNEFIFDQVFQILKYGILLNSFVHLLGI